VVDAAADPLVSNKYVQRVAGAVRNEPPRTSTKWENKTQQWMVDEVWLADEANAQYDVETRIVDSGKLWGEDDDPEELAAKREKLKTAKKVLVETKKRKKLENAIKQGTSKKGKKTKGKGKEKANVTEQEGDNDDSE
jgi:hypothetical protein